MKWVRSAAGVLVAFGAAISGQAQLAVIPEAIDLGRVKQNQRIERVVEIANHGLETVNILRVFSDCSCTAGNPETMELAPGARTTMKIIAETRQYQGEIHRRITLHSTAGEAAVAVKMQVSAFDDWIVSPARVVLPPSQKGQEAKLTITLTRTGAAEVRPLEAKSNLPWLDVTLAPAERAETYLLHLRKPAGAAPTGNLSAIVTVKTSDPAQSLISIPVFIPVLSDVSVAPNPIILPPATVGQEAKGYFRLFGWKGAQPPTAKMAFGVVRPAGENDGEYSFEITVTPAQPGTVSQMVQIYDGAKLELEAPVIVRVQTGS